jgi:hypothetical protein
VSWVKEFQAVKSDVTRSDISLGCFATVKMRKIVQVEQNKRIVAPNAGELSIILIYKHASLVHLKNLNKGSLSRKKHFQIVKKEANTSRDLKQASIISPPILSNHRAFLCSNSICSQSIRKITQYRSYLTAKQGPSTMDHIN